MIPTTQSNLSWDLFPVDSIYLDAKYLEADNLRYVVKNINSNPSLTSLILSGCWTQGYVLNPLFELISHRSNLDIVKLNSMRNPLYSKELLKIAPLFKASLSYLHLITMRLLTKKLKKLSHFLPIIQH